MVKTCLRSYRLIASVMDGKDKPPELAGLKNAGRVLNYSQRLLSIDKRDNTSTKNYPKIMWQLGFAIIDIWNNNL